MVAPAGLEPALRKRTQILSLLRLPLPPRGHEAAYIMTYLRGLWLMSRRYA